jgi:hypothetical protein
MSYYTEPVQRAFKTKKWPFAGFYVDMIEHQDYLELRVYEENIAEFNEMQKVALAEALYNLRDTIRMLGAKCHIQGSKNPVPNRKWKGN